MFATPAVAADLSPRPSISTVAISAADRRFAARCARDPIDLDGLLSDNAFRADIEALTNDEKIELVDYGACRALQGAPGACSSLDIVGSGVGENSIQCLELATQDRFLFQILRGGDALGTCLKFVEKGGKPGASGAKSCNAMIAAVRGGNAMTACAVLAREKIIGPKDSCEEFVAAWSGQPQACSRIKDEHDRHDCLGRATLVAGLRDPAKCASSPSCQALSSKSSRACGGLGARFIRARCTRVAANLSAEKKRLADEEARSPEKMKERRLQVEKEAAAAERAKIAAMENQVKDLAAKQAQAKAAAEAGVRAKAEAEAKKVAKAKAKTAEMVKPQFLKGAPMQSVSEEAKENMKALEEGRPIPVPKSPKKQISKKEKTLADE